MNRRSALLLLSAAPLVTKTDLLSKDDLAVLKLAARLQHKEGKSWEHGSEMSETIQSLARRGYLEKYRTSVHEDGGEITWCRPTEKGSQALKETS